MLKDFRREKELLHWIRFGVWDADHDQQMEKRIQLLLEEGVDINYIDGVTDCTDDDLPSYMSCYGGESKQSLLMHAIENSSYMVATWLIEEGANLELKNQKGQTALSLACFMGYVDLVQLMMNSGAFIDTVDNDGNTPLISAVNKGNIAVSTLLLESGCDADITNQQGHCALIDACINRYPAMVTLLLNFGADMTKTIGRAMYTPLMIACKYQCYDIVASLLKNGARTDITNANGQDARSILVSNTWGGNTTPSKRNDINRTSLLYSLDDIFELFKTIDMVSTDSI